MWAQFYIIYGNYASAVVALAFMVFGIGVGIFSLVVFYWQDGTDFLKGSRNNREIVNQNDVDIEEGNDTQYDNISTNVNNHSLSPFRVQDPVGVEETKSSSYDDEYPHDPPTFSFNNTCI